MTSFDAWRVACPAATQKDVSCEMVQDFVDSQSHSEIARIAVGKLPGGKPAIDITMFLGVALEPGVGLSAGHRKGAHGAIPHLHPAGLHRGYPDRRQAAGLARCRQGREVGCSRVIDSDKLIGMPLTLKGYGDAKRAYNRDEAKRGSWFWRMWS